MLAPPVNSQKLLALKEEMNKVILLVFCAGTVFHVHCRALLGPRRKQRKVEVNSPGRTEALFQKMRPAGCYSTHPAIWLLYHHNAINTD